MKKLIIPIAIAIIANLSPCFASYDEEELRPVNPQHIVVRNESPNFHRSLETPIYAYYANGTITLNFVENMCASTVTVQNLTTEDQISDLVDTGISNAVIDIDTILTVGDYYMTITTMSGEFYYAEFTLE